MKVVAESQIKSSFKGWGKHVYQLTNGEAWKQSIYKYDYHYAYMPKAKIWQDGSRYYLEVEGMRDMVEVNRASSSDVEEAEKEE